MPSLLGLLDNLLADLGLHLDSCRRRNLFLVKGLALTCSVCGMFDRYRLRSKVDIENVAEEFSCWQRYGRNLSGSSSVGWGGGVDRAGESTASGNKYGWQWYEDPRLDCLGYRSIFPSDATRKVLDRIKALVLELWILMLLTLFCSAFG